MKYGASLRAHSIPAWSHHNVDYDEIKTFIKEHTTPGIGKAVSIPGTGDVRGRQFEDDLYNILYDQHKRINQFVRSKSGEIKRRLDHLQKQIQELGSQRSLQNSRIPAKRLERFGRLETDVLKAGDELRSLSRFTTAQQTAFRKLIKKYKKWTGSTELGARFYDDVLDQPSSFTKIDLEPVLDEWAETLAALRALYDQRIGATATSSKSDLKPSQAEVKQSIELKDVLASNSAVKFDNYMATLPLGAAGKNAVYWVHPENIVELRVQLLQYSRAHTVHRQPPVSASSQSGSRHNSHSSVSGRDSYSDLDTGLLVVDDEDRYIKEQSSTTLEAKENASGVLLQNALISARWTAEDEAIIAARLSNSNSSEIKQVVLPRREVATIFDTSSCGSASEASDALPDTFHESIDGVAELRSWLAGRDSYKPLASISSNRQRFVETGVNSAGFLLVTLDKNICMKQTDSSDVRSIGEPFPSVKDSNFPYAVLRVRQEGTVNNDLVHMLDNSHLVERVRGFSLAYHAVWQCCQPQNTVPPFWMSLLKKDIRKVPKMTHKREVSILDASFGSQSETPQGSTRATSSVSGGNGETTATEHGGHAGHNTADLLMAPPLSSFRKKRRSYAECPRVPGPRYYSEYDHPSDSDDEDAYVLYIDPNQESTFTQMFRGLRGLFNKQGDKDGAAHEPLLQDIESGDTDDSDSEVPSPRRIAARRGYGTLDGATEAGVGYNSGMVAQGSHWLPPVTLTCLVASISILVVGFLLAATGRKRQFKEVDAGIIFAIASSLLFAVSGLAYMLGKGRSASWSAKAVAMVVVAMDVVASSGLLAWVLA